MASLPSPPQVSTTKGMSSASWRLAMAAYFVRFPVAAFLAVAVEFAGFKQLGTSHQCDRGLKGGGGMDRIERLCLPQLSQLSQRQLSSV
jgi:hypothetical protein